MNIVPVIAKADTLTPKEVAELKKRVLKELECHEVMVYQLPECDEDEDDEFKDTDRQLKVITRIAQSVSLPQNSILNLASFVPSLCLERVSLRDHFTRPSDRQACLSVINNIVKVY